MYRTCGWLFEQANFDSIIEQIYKFRVIMRVV